MKIKITKTSEREATALSRALKSALAGYIRENSAVEKLNSRREVLVEEIGRIQAEVDPSDTKAISDLRAKRDELDVIETRLNSLPVTATPTAESLRQCLLETGEVVSRALMPAYRAMEQEIAGLMEPYFRDGHHLRVAREAHALQDFGIVMNYRFGVSTTAPSIPEAQRVVKLLDEILAGELSWKFQQTSQAI